MAVLTLLGLASETSIPSGFWETLWAWLILDVFKFIADYGWRVILFTLILKLLLSPLDIYQRVAMKKNQRITERLKPEMEKLEKQYGSNPKALQQKKAELNKREGIKMAAGCLPMVLTLLISIWLLMGGLNPISQYKNMEQYLKLYDVYTAAEMQEKAKFSDVYDFEYDDGKIKSAKLKDVSALSPEELDAFNDLEAEAIAAVRTSAQGAVKQAYDSEIRESFLWVKNIWVTDAPWAKPIMDESAFLGAVGDYGKKPEMMGLAISQEEFDIVMADYEKVTEHLFKSAENTANGFLILPILSILVMIGSQMLMHRIQKKSGQLAGAMAGPMGGVNGKMMAYMMPVIFGIFALMFTTAFSLYMITNSFVMIIISLLATFFMRVSDKREGERQLTDDGIVRYGRPDPNKKAAQSVATKNEK